MCGRYSIATDVRALQDAFDVVADLAEEFARPRYNVAPSRHVPVVCADAAGGRALVMARWGFTPSWARDPANLPQPINAKAETAAVKPMFRHAYRNSRVLVPATAFYEWQAGAGRKQPYCFALADGGLFAFGGLLAHWNGPAGPQLSFAILTTRPNALCAKVHERMPVIVARERYATWLSAAVHDPLEIATLTGPYPADEMRAWPVATRVNNVRNDDAALLEPVGPDAA